MVINILEKCRERQRELEDTFYKMVDDSHDIPTLEKMCDEMINVELMIIRLEKQAFDNKQKQEMDYAMC